MISGIDIHWLGSDHSEQLYWFQNPLSFREKQCKYEDVSSWNVAIFQDSPGTKQVPQTHHSPRWLWLVQRNTNNKGRVLSSVLNASKWFFSPVPLNSHHVQDHLPVSAARSAQVTLPGSEPSSQLSNKLPGIAVWATVSLSPISDTCSPELELFVITLTPFSSLFSLWSSATFSSMLFTRIIRQWAVNYWSGPQIKTSDVIVVHNVNITQYIE